MERIFRGGEERVRVTQGGNERGGLRGGEKAEDYSGGEEAESCSGEEKWRGHSGEGMRGALLRGRRKERRI